MNKLRKKTMVSTSRSTKMTRVAMLGLLMSLPLTSVAQGLRVGDDTSGNREALATERDARMRLLTLDSCRAMALRNNKQLGAAKMKLEVNANQRKSARTQYLPKVNAVGGYMWMSREVSLLNDDQKEALSNLGTNATGKLQDALSPLV